MTSITVRPKGGQWFIMTLVRDRAFYSPRETTSERSLSEFALVNCFPVTTDMPVSLTAAMWDDRKKAISGHRCIVAAALTIRLSSATGGIRFDRQRQPCVMWAYAYACDRLSEICCCTYTSHSGNQKVLLTPKGCADLIFLQYDTSFVFLQA